jgi:phospholipid/cholesterol/gamma-HCH transport system substrate-binding protein
VKTVFRDDDIRFQRLARKIGLFVFLIIGAVGLTALAIGMRQELFTPKTVISFESDSGQDITRGLPVKLSGFQIGKVEALELTEDARVRVTLSINNEYMKWVRHDSAARLKQEGLIGNTIIDVVPGTAASPPLNAGDTIRFERDRGLARVAEELYAEVAPLLRDLKKIAHYVEDPQGDIKQSFAGARELVQALGGTQKRLDALLATLQQDVPGVLRTGRETLDNSKKVVDSLSRTWPIKNNIQPPQPGLLPVDSYVPGNATTGTAK